ncbi:MAG: hypothetical protein ABR543_08090 [Gemmatimonadaceae bacterium]
MRRWPVVMLALLAAACTMNKTDGTDSATGGMASDTGMAGMESDPDRATGGSGVPAGFLGRVDRDDAKIDSVKYVASGDSWEITTGPAHILYSASNTASGNYTAKATIEQLEAPKHPEAFGMLIGGSNLDQPAQKYTYFLVRGTGDYLVKVRDGKDTKDVVKWTASDVVPKADASGKATYALAVRVTADSVHFMVNDKQATAVAKSSVPTDGIVGLRVNHNLRVKTSGVSIN